MTGPTEHQKYCMNICIKKQRQSNQRVSQLCKGVVILKTIQRRSKIMSNKCATPCLNIALGMSRLSHLRIVTSFN